MFFYYTYYCNILHRKINFILYSANNIIQLYEIFRGVSMRMLKSERQNLILKILNDEKKIIASELSNRLKVSEDTIRRDLNELDEKGLLKRVHSGALRLGPEIVDFSTRENVDLEEKIRLAKKGLRYIKPNLVILIDGGTTNYQLVKQISKDIHCTIITNSIPIMMLLKEYENINTIILGGNLYKKSSIAVGYDTIRQLECIHADVYFMGISHIDNDAGISIATIDECHTKQKMLSTSSKTIGMVTKEKLGTIANFIVCKTSDLTYIITDENA